MFLICTALCLLMLMSPGAGMTCEDADPNCVCIGLICFCENGYVLDGFNCVLPDIDECSTMMDNCHENATCTDTDGSFTCMCNEGYSGDGETCDDIDECDINTHNCDGNANCTNTDGNFTCECIEGWSGDGETCTDIDECSTMMDDCHDNATCTDTDGSFTCVCNNGFSGDGVETCDNIDECGTNMDNCHDNATCTDTVGNFTCACNDGYSGDGVTCYNIDECSTMTEDCHDNATCTNTDGSFTCACNDGYSGNGVTCDNIDECTMNTDNCDPEAFCTDTDGSFICTCTNGYSGDGVNCDDVDECTLGTDNCPTESTCENTPAGDFSCPCNKGYHGSQCTDVDECSIFPCGQNAVTHASCTNTVGSFTCTCDMGYAYTGNGVQCEAGVPGILVVMTGDSTSQDANVLSQILSDKDDYDCPTFDVCSAGYFCSNVDVEFDAPISQLQENDVEIIFYGTVVTVTCSPDPPAAAAVNFQANVANGNILVTLTAEQTAEYLAANLPVFMAAVTQCCDPDQLEACCAVVEVYGEVVTSTVDGTVVIPPELIPTTTTTPMPTTTTTPTTTTPTTTTTLPPTTTPIPVPSTQYSFSVSGGTSSTGFTNFVMGQIEEDTDDFCEAQTSNCCPGGSVYGRSSAKLAVEEFRDEDRVVFETVVFATCETNGVTVRVPVAADVVTSVLTANLGATAQALENCCTNRLVSDCCVAEVTGVVTAGADGKTVSPPTRARSTSTAETIGAIVGGFGILVVIVVVFVVLLWCRGTKQVVLRKVIRSPMVYGQLPIKRFQQPLRAVGFGGGPYMRPPTNLYHPSTPQYPALRRPVVHSRRYVY